MFIPWTTTMRLSRRNWRLVWRMRGFAKISENAKKYLSYSWLLTRVNKLHNNEIISLGEAHTLNNFVWSIFIDRSHGIESHEAEIRYQGLVSPSKWHINCHTSLNRSSIKQHSLNVVAHCRLMYWNFIGFDETYPLTIIRATF